MLDMRRPLTVLALGAASAITLAGCAGSTASDEGVDAISVVASTNVYGQIAEEIGGDLIDVTSIITSDAQDPHSYEASARDELTIADADLIIENGGGYDAYMDSMIEASGSEAPVITAVEFSHDWPENDGHEDEHADETESDETEHAEDEHAEDEHAEDEHAEDEHDHDHEHVEGFNEHVWYDPHTIEHVAEAIADELGELDSANAAAYAANAESFIAEIADLEDALGAIDADHAGEQVFVTEPVPVYLIEAGGLVNATPEEFSEAVEEGNDVPPATLLASLDLLDGGDIRVVIENTQTGGAETVRITDEAASLGIPVIAFSETLPEGQTYISWMQENIETLSGALAE